MTIWTKAVNEVLGFPNKAWFACKYRSRRICQFVKQILREFLLQYDLLMGSYKYQVRHSLITGLPLMNGRARGRHVRTTPPPHPPSKLLHRLLHYCKVPNRVLDSLGFEQSRSRLFPWLMICWKLVYNQTSNDHIQVLGFYNFSREECFNKSLLDQGTSFSA